MPIYRWSVLVLAVAFLSGFAAWTSSALADGPEAVADENAHSPDAHLGNILRLPWEFTNAFRSDPEFTQWPWVCDPEYMHNTGPTPDEFQFLGEFDLTNGVLFGWSGCLFAADQTELIRASLSTTAEVTILASQSDIPAAKHCLRAHGLTRAQIEQINFVPIPVDSIWIRDYGPEFLSHGSDPSARAIVDPTYFGVIPRPENCRPLNRGPLLSFGRSHDDASPTRLAELVQRGTAELRGVTTVTPHRAPLVFDGGNIFTDGKGTCFRNGTDTTPLNSELDFFRDPSIIGGWNYTEDDISALIGEYYNCEKVVMLESLRPTTGQRTGGIIDHIDMFMTLLSPEVVLMGDYNYQTEEGLYLTRSANGDPDDPVNAAILDRNAALMEELGYTVVRIPMPTPFCARHQFFNCTFDQFRDLSSDTIIECPADVYDSDGVFEGAVDAETGKPVYRTWATFANSIRIGDGLMMPSYQASYQALPEDLRELLQAQEDEAFKIYQRELDDLYGSGTVTVMRVQSDGLAPCFGSLQCITKTY